MYLNGHSWFSLRYGVLSVKQLVEAARKKGISALALTDTNNTSAALEFVRECRAAGIRPILGIEFRLDGRLLYVGVARNREGWFQLCQFLTEHSLAEKPLPEVAPDLPDCFFIYEKLTKPLEFFNENEFLGIRPNQVPGLFSSNLKKRLDKLLAWLPTTFDEPTEGWRLHKLLRAIDQNTLVTKLRLEDLAQPDEVFLTENEVEQAFQLFPKLVENARRIADCCQIDFETGLQLNRKSFTGSKDGDFALLSKLAKSGSERRFGKSHTRARERLEKELKVIRKLDFCAYFLITWDIVRYAQSIGYHHVGRGSGANSIVAYCLWITDVDPLELDLYFERFINPHRSSPPDFDIDFSWDERDDVTDYIFKRYGREHTALLATYSTFQMNALVRELGKVFGLPKAEIDQIGDSMPEILMSSGEWEWSWGKRGGGDLPAPPVENSQKNQVKNCFEKLNPRARQILKYAALLKDFPNYLSIHAGGVIISEEPLNRATALQMMPKGFPITHFDMYGAEDWGFHKFDVLSQRGLGHIKETVEIVRRNRGVAVDIHDIEYLKNDEKTRNQLRSGQCMGCFYIESPAMRGLLTKLRCENYVHLVAASSIIRPGVAQSGMMREYIRRFHSPNGFKSVHPVFRENLSETFEVMVYQEDVMKIVHHFAGLDLDESDVLRRMMTGKKRSSEAFERLKNKYFDNCRARNYPEELTKEVWRQIESFSGYSFCKAHSASFAVESFQSLYLKAHFPKEFMVAVINNFGGFYPTEFYVHELRRAGAAVHPPCVNRSEYLTSISGEEVWLGLVHLKGLTQQTAQDLVAQRRSHGKFRSLTDFVRRVNVRPDDLVILIRIGAFRFTGASKCALMWEKNALLGEAFETRRAGLLFENEDEGFELPELVEHEFDQSFDELELLGFSLRSPFELLQTEVFENAAPAQQRQIFSKNLKENVGKPVEMLGYYVCRKDVRTVRGQIMFFGTWLDAAGLFFDTVHFPSKNAAAKLSGKGIYRLRGRVVLDFGFPSLEVDFFEKLPFRSDLRNG